MTEQDDSDDSLRQETVAARKSSSLQLESPMSNISGVSPTLGTSRNSLAGSSTTPNALTYSIQPYDYDDISSELFQDMFCDCSSTAPVSPSEICKLTSKSLEEISPIHGSKVSGASTCTTDNANKSMFNPPKTRESILEDYLPLRMKCDEKGADRKKDDTLFMYRPDLDAYGVQVLTGDKCSDLVHQMCHMLSQIRCHSSRTAAKRNQSMLKLRKYDATAAEIWKDAVISDQVIEHIDLGLDHLKVYLDTVKQAMHNLIRKIIQGMQSSGTTAENTKRMEETVKNIASKLNRLDDALKRKMKDIQKLRQSLIRQQNGLITLHQWKTTGHPVQTDSTIVQKMETVAQIRQQLATTNDIAKSICKPGPLQDWLTSRRADTVLVTDKDTTNNDSDSDKHDKQACAAHMYN